MIKHLKSNKIISIFLFIICLFFIIKPSICINSCLNAVSVWGFKVFPLLFPFFVFTRIIVNLSVTKPNFMDKLFNKLYNAPAGSFMLFCLSVLSGYPMGAKLIGSMLENKQITQNQAKKMLAFCSISGPMFIIGTVGVSIFLSFKAGVIILISNIIACLINGLIYRGKSCKYLCTEYNSKKQNLADIVYDSLISILMVGAYIILSFLIIDALKESKILTFLSTIFSKLFNCDTGLIESLFAGIVEITRGVVELNNVSIPLNLKTIIASGIIGFGGISVFLQSISFLSKFGFSKKLFFCQKLTQGLLSLLIAIPFSLLL